MRQQYKVVCLLLLFISGYQTQDSTTTTAPLPDWHGDPLICTVNTPTTPSPTPGPPLPKFTNQAEYTLERVIIKNTSSSTSPSELTLHHYIHDYDNNKLTVVENRNGTFDTQFYDYNTLKHTTYYYREDTCLATVIETDIDIRGRSATRIENGTWHIRPMNEFLLFSSNVSGRQVTPIYRGQDVVRGIPVEKWESCYIDRARYITEKRTWSFSQQGIPMPSGVVGELGVPIQAIINGSIINPNNTDRFEFEEVLNVLSYRQSLIESAYQITPPRGVYCDNIQPEQLVTLKDVGISWPYRFNVRIEASTSRSAQWQSFHLYYHQGDNELTSRLRYDYLPEGAEDFKSVIHDYTDNLTYTIDRQVGTCNITRGVEIPDVNPLLDPIRFFIKNEARFIFSPREKAWENKGLRTCRGDSIKCVILTTSENNFPVIVEPDAREPSGETWKKTNIEYTWTRRSSNANSSSNATIQFDYPVSLYLKMYPNENSPSSFTQMEDIEYEFFEMSHDGNQNQFDTSTCYRALDYEYLHLTFVFKLNRGNIIDGNYLSRRLLDSQVHYNLINRMQIRYSRITGLEIEHERVSNDVTVFFTILGQTPNPESNSSFIDDEPTAAEARDNIKQVIDDGKFEFNMKLEDGSEVNFRAEPGSLKSSKQYMSTHSAGQKVTNESYTVDSQVIAAVVGSVAGLLAGIILAAVIRVVRKKPMPSLPSKIYNPIPTTDISLRTRAQTTSEI